MKHRIVALSQWNYCNPLSKKKKKDIKKWEMTAPKTCPHSLPRSVEMF